MNISKIGQQIVTTGIEAPLDRLSNAKFVGKITNKFRSGDIRFAATLGITSIILKDGLGCYMYVKQSLENKKIPSDKRKFVAALDMTNGGLMILMQILMFKTISNEKFQEKLFNKLFGKYFNRAARKGYYSVMKNKAKFASLDGKEFNKAFEGFKKKCTGTFGAITSLIAATIIAKRVIVPFIATPLADYAKGYMTKGDKDTGFSAEAQNTYNKKGAKLDITEKDETNLIKAQQK